MKSMTGFASENISTSWSDCEINVKTVNGRFLEFRCFTPKELSSLDGDIRKIVQTSIRRGTVDVSIHRRPHAKTLKSQIEIKANLARQWMQAFNKLKKDVGLQSEVPLELLLKSINALQVEERYPVSPAEADNIKKGLNKALKKLNQARLTEGRALQKDLQQNLKSLEKLCAQMRLQRTAANRLIAERFWSKFSSLKSKMGIDENRISHEVALLLDRSDINEELVRLKEHLRVMAGLLKGTGPVGKKLDFYTQELLREVNTIGSKSQLATLTHLVVECKGIIERMREQVQNIE